MELEGLDTVCAGLGCPSQDPNAQYIKGEHCLENLKHLQRFLRRDHPTGRPVFRQLGKWNTVGRDLVPIISRYRDDLDLVINAVKVVVFLTMPVDPLSENVSQQVEYMLEFKVSFLHNDAIAVIMTLLETPLEHLESHTFSEDDWKVVQLVLTLIRNLLDIQDASAQKIVASENLRVLAIRDQMLEHLFEENVMDLLLALVYYVSGPAPLLKQDSLLFLEIFHHIFWFQSPEKIARVNDPNSRDKNSKEASGLLREMAEVEQEQLREIRLKELSRHSRFSGSFVRVAEDGSKQMLKRNPFQSSIETVLKGPRFKHGPVKRVACDRISSTTSERKVVELLKSLADQILSGSYNVVMQSVKDDISRERNGIQSSDVTLFFEVAKFFTAYQRYKFSILKADCRSKDNSDTLDSDTSCVFQGKLCGPVASTMDEDMFAMVVSRWHMYAEGAKETKDWKSLTVTGSLFKEMIRLLDVVLRDAQDQILSGQQEVRVARILLYKVFYDQTETGTLSFLLHLLKSFDIHQQPRSHLVDLVETVHVVLRIVEFLTNEDGALRVLKKSRRTTKKKRKEKDVGHEQNCVGIAQLDNISEVNVDLEHNDIQGGQTKPPDVDENAVQPTIMEQEIISSTEVCKDGFMENQDSIPIELRDLHTSEISKHSLSLSRKQEKEETPVPLNKPNGEDDENDSDEDMEHEVERQNQEVSLDVKKCAAKFADNTVIRNYCWLLKSFMNNTSATNHYILCMLQRICKDYELEPMLFQLSLFQTFYEILSNKKASKLEEHQRLFSFLTKLVRNFFKKLKTQPLLFLDVLFWKNRNDCHLITVEYKAHSLRKMGNKNGKRMKTSISDALGDDEAAAPRSLADALGDDEAGDEPWSTIDKIDHGIDSKLEAMPDRPKRLNMQGCRRKRVLFSKEQEAQLRELFEQYKENAECCEILAKAIDPDGNITATHVRRKLKSMNFKPPVLRRKLRKQQALGKEIDDNIIPKSKPMKSSKEGKQQISDNSDEELSTDDGSSSDDETLTQMMERMRGNCGEREVVEKNPGKVTEHHNENDHEEDDDEPIQTFVAKRKRSRLTKVGSSLEARSGRRDKTMPFPNGAQPIDGDFVDTLGEATGNASTKAGDGASSMEAQQFNGSRMIQLEDNFSDQAAPIAPSEEPLEDELSDENSPLTVTHEEEGASTIKISKRYRAVYVHGDDDDEEM